MTDRRLTAREVDWIFAQLRRTASLLKQARTDFERGDASGAIDRRRTDEAFERWWARIKESAAREDRKAGGVTIGTCLRLYLEERKLSEKMFAWDLCCQPSRLPELLECVELVTEETLDDRVRSVARLLDVQYEALGVAVTEGLELFRAGARAYRAARAEPKQTAIPVLGRIAAGRPIEMAGEIEGPFELTRYPGVFAVRIVGDSMSDAGFRDGAHAFVAPEEPVRDGEIAAVAVGDEATLKRIYRVDGGLKLVPANPKYAPAIVPGPDVRILGRVVGCYQQV